MSWDCHQAQIIKRSWLLIFWHNVMEWQLLGVFTKLVDGPNSADGPWPIFNAKETYMVPGVPGESIVVS